MRILAIETSCDETAIAILDVRNKKLEVGKKTNENLEFSILSNQVSSQIKIHKPFGGVVPHLAQREHQKNLVPILLTALREAKLLKNNTPSYSPLLRGRSKKNVPSFTRRGDGEVEAILSREPELLKLFKKYVLKIPPPQIDAIAVTYGPGLEPALWVGINFAKALSLLWKKPLIAVNHLGGHIYAAWLSGVNSKSEFLISKQIPTSKSQFPKFPLLALIVSGGHTELVLMKKHLNYKILGETRDDAAGEAFDKVAKMLGLGYPGGPLISKLAEKGNPKTPILILPIRKGEENLKKKEELDSSSLPLPPYEWGRGYGGKGLFPRPMINSKDFDFSFSGLKTAVLYYLQDNPKADKAVVASEFQQAVVDVLVKKTSDALQKYKVKSLVVGGGVAANNALRLTLYALMKNKFPNVSLYISPLWLCGDNAAMIAVAAYFKSKARKFSKPENVKAEGGLKL